jgi:predicted ATPase/DNA-binding CsgD family transcriptional regulator
LPVNGDPMVAWRFVGGSGTRRGAGLPAETTSFVGRRHELAEAKRLLSVSRLLTLTGVGGVGKTRLAVRVAGQLSRAFPDGVWLVSLATLDDDALVPHAVADVLGIRGDTPGKVLDVVVEYLRERRLLLVLDNCEHLLDACTALVEAILPVAVEVRVLATSRHRLNLTGEQLLEVPPLRVPTLEELARGVFTAKTFPALELFTDRAATAVPGFKMTAGNQEHMAQLCHRLDGLPLAIELAAMRMRSLSIKQLVKWLDDRYRLLTGGRRTALSRHQTLRAAMDWSYELCTRQEQLVWAMLSVFAGSFDLSAAEAVCVGEDIESADILDTVADLVDKSILVGEHYGGAIRYRLLSSLRNYGLEKLTELGKVSAARRRHRDYYLRLAEACERQWFGPRQLQIVESLRTELDNFRAALTFCVTTPGEAQDGLNLAGVLWCYWNPCGVHYEMRYWFHQALRQGAKPSGVRLKPLWAGGTLTLIHTRSAAVLLAGAPPDQPAQAREDLPAATPVAGSIPDWQRADEELMGFVVLSRVELACTLVFQAKPDQAVPLCVEAVAICEAHEEQWARSYALRTLAMAQWALGDYDSATTRGRECLRLKYVVHDRQSLGRTLDLLAAVAASAGDAERAAVLQGAAERIWHGTARNPLESQPRTGRIRASERQARKILGDHRFERARQRGGELSRDDVVAYALADRSKAPGQSVSARTTPAAAGESSGIRLTPRERQVAELVVQGLTDKQIAAALVIAQRTAEGHVQRILAKLGLANRTQLAAWFSSKRSPDVPDAVKRGEGAALLQRGAVGEAGTGHADQLRAGFIVTQWNHHRLEQPAPRFGQFRQQVPLLQVAQPLAELVVQGGPVCHVRRVVVLPRIGEGVAVGQAQCREADVVELALGVPGRPVVEVLPWLDIERALQIAAGRLVTEPLDEVLIGVPLGFDDLISQFVLHGGAPRGVSVNRRAG